MKKVFSITAMFAAFLLAVSTTGCATARDAVTKEYDRLANTVPAPPVRCEYDRAIDNLGVAVGVNYAFAHKNMKEFVDFTTNHREYLGFLNDIKFYMEEEKLDEKAAMEKVVKGIQAEDAKVTDPKEKVWPRIVAAIKASESLKIENKLGEIAVVVAANVKNAKTVADLKNSFKGFDAPTIAKGIACVEIAGQALFTSECLGFIAEQYRRTLKAKYYAK